MPFTLYYRPETGLPMPAPLAEWESPAQLVFPTMQALKATADAQGIKTLFYDGPEALFPDCAAGTAIFCADAEEEVWGLAVEHSPNPEDVRCWPPGFELLCFLTFWRLALNETGARLELAHD